MLAKMINEYVEVDWIVELLVEIQDLLWLLFIKTFIIYTEYFRAPGL